MDPSANIPLAGPSSKPMSFWARGLRVLRRWLSRLDLGNTITIYRVDEGSGDTADQDAANEFDGISYDSAVFDLIDLEVEALEDEDLDAAGLEEDDLGTTRLEACSLDHESPSDSGTHRLHLDRQVVSLPPG